MLHCEPFAKQLDIDLRSKSLREDDIGIVLEHGKVAGGYSAMA